MFIFQYCNQSNFIKDRVEANLSNFSQRIALWKILYNLFDENILKGFEAL